jgi:hypothetical protein
MVYPWEIHEKDDSPNPVRTAIYDSREGRWLFCFCSDGVKIYPPPTRVVDSDGGLVFEGWEEPRCTLRLVDGRWALDTPEGAN